MFEIITVLVCLLLGSGFAASSWVEKTVKKVERRATESYAKQKPL
jgi:hypothetical protein